MLPLSLDITTSPILLVGRGPALERRVALVRQSGARQKRVHAAEEAAGLPSGMEIAAARLLFVAGLPTDTARPLAEAARERRVLVNVEDVPALCDFHIPALVRRGDLSIAISTAGRGPGLAAALRRRLERQFGAEWAGQVAAAGSLRARLRDAGLPPAEIAREMERRTDAWLRPGPDPS